MAPDAVTKEIIQHCLSRIASGDPGAVFDLASTFMAHVDAKNIDINLAVVEALATLAKFSGDVEAERFLEDQWPTMQTMLRKRWMRGGFV